MGEPDQLLDHGARWARVSSNVTNGTIRGVVLEAGSLPSPVITVY